MTDQHTIFGHGDDAGLLADHNGNGVGVFRNAKAGAVAGAHILAQIQIVGKGQHAARRLDAAVFDDGSTVMQGGALVEDGAQHLQIDRAVNRGAGAHDLGKVGVALQHDERAGLSLRKALGGITDGNNSAAPCALQAGVVIASLYVEQLGSPLVGLTHALQCAADLRLEQHHKGEQTDLQQRVEQPGNGAHIQGVGHQIHDHDQQRTLGQLPGAGAIDDAQQLVDQERDDDDIQQIDNFKGLKICDDRIQCHACAPLTQLRSGRRRGRQCPVPRR